MGRRNKSRRPQAPKRDRRARLEDAARRRSTNADQVEQSMYHRPERYGR